MVDKRDEADKLIDEMIAGKTPEEIVGEGGVLQALTKRVYERALEGEMTHHLGCPPKARGRPSEMSLGAFARRPSIDMHLQKTSVHLARGIAFLKPDESLEFV